MEYTQQYVVREIVDKYPGFGFPPGTLVHFLGHAGAGKGSQVKIMKGVLDANKKEYIVQPNGDTFRFTLSTANPDTRFAHMMKVHDEKNELQHHFWPIAFFWQTNKYIYRDQTVIIDGSPRSEAEYYLWKSFLRTSEKPECYFSNMVIIHLDIPDEEAFRRMWERVERKEAGAKQEIIKKIDRYKETKEMVSRFKTLPWYCGEHVHFVEVDATGTKMDVSDRVYGELSKLLPHLK